MISKDHVQNIFDRCFTEIECSGETYLLKVEMPNKFTFAVTGFGIDECMFLAKHYIKTLESYLEQDKKFYNYDLESEYE